MSAHLALPAPTPVNLDPVQLRTALADLCTHTFAIVERQTHAQQLYRAACDRRIPVRLPQPSSGGWRVELE